MRKYEEKQVTRKEKLLVETSCDLCGRIAKYGNWDSSCYIVADTEVEVKIKYRDGHSFPECGYGTEYKVDICPDCFRNKLVPWLESQGVDREFEDWECW